MKVWALLATGSPDWVQVTAITTGMLALATFVLAGLTWVGVRENKQLIGLEQKQVASLQRQTDLLWENAIPHILPGTVEHLTGEGFEMSGELTVYYASGTIPTSVHAWLGHEGKVWVGAAEILTPTDRDRVLDMHQSRAGSEPPAEWDHWLRREQENVTHRVLIRWEGPPGNLIQRAWWSEWGSWIVVLSPD
jgi:hypothetical protein